MKYRKRARVVLLTMCVYICSGCAAETKIQESRRVFFEMTPDKRKRARNKRFDIFRFQGRKKMPR